MLLKSFHDTFLGLQHCRGMLLKTQSVLGTWRAWTKDGVPSKLPLLWTLIKLLFMYRYCCAYGYSFTLTMKLNDLRATCCINMGTVDCHRVKMSNYNMFVGHKPQHTSAVGPDFRAASPSSSGCLDYETSQRVQKFLSRGETSHSAPRQR